jgi:hypothetical protein
MSKKELEKEKAEKLQKEKEDAERQAAQDDIKGFLTGAATKKQDSHDGNAEQKEDTSGNEEDEFEDAVEASAAELDEHKMFEAIAEQKRKKKAIMKPPPKINIKPDPLSDMLTDDDGPDKVMRLFHAGLAALTLFTFSMRKKR